MAKKRKKNHKPEIKKWTTRHTNLVNAVARFNILTVENAKKITEVAGKCMSDNAFLDMEELGYFKVEKIEYKGKDIELIIGLDKKGERSIRDINSETINNIYNSSSLAHDLEHSNYVFNDFSIQDIQKYYRSEKELETLGHGTSVVDGAMIYDDGRECLYIETETQYYTKEQKEAHKAYADKMKGEYIPNRVRIPKKSL